MATYAETHAYHAVEQTGGAIRTTQWAAPIGRFLFSLIFILSGFKHFSAEMIDYAASSGVPMANVLVPLSGVMALAGGLSVLLGFHARIGALILVAFLVPVTFMMHNFWAISDPEMASMQMIHFMKNISMLGGAIYIYSMGSGPFSLDKGKYRY